MRLIGIVVVCGVVAAVACSAVPQEPRSEQGNNQKPTLWDSDRSVLFPALRQFAQAPGTTPDQQFVPVEKQNDGTLLFTKVPEGWTTWKEEKDKGRVLLRDQDGFRILIQFERVPDLSAAIIDHIQCGQGLGSLVLIDSLFASNGAQGTRVVKCAKYKGDTNFTENRYFETEKGAICVELTVFDEPEKKRTLGHLLAFLRAHYGKYEGICQQVEVALGARR